MVTKPCPRSPSLPWPCRSLLLVHLATRCSGSAWLAPLLFGAGPETNRLQSANRESPMQIICFSPMVWMCVGKWVPSCLSTYSLLIFFLSWLSCFHCLPSWALIQRDQSVHDGHVLHGTKHRVAEKESRKETPCTLAPIQTHSFTHAHAHRTPQAGKRSHSIVPPPPSELRTGHHYSKFRTESPRVAYQSAIDAGLSQTWTFPV
ncbi:hypothetical protein B0O80DRAFT_447602 [Mortierella sp. GBAus27b]|nr:hypothetical protein B0O80DRAFT_447602 [Mortierella sp. GBAus27b]